MYRIFIEFKLEICFILFDTIYWVKMWQIVLGYFVLENLEKCKVWFHMIENHGLISCDHAWSNSIKFILF